METRTRYVLFGALALTLVAVIILNFTLQDGEPNLPVFLRGSQDQQLAASEESSDNVEISLGGQQPPAEPEPYPAPQPPFTDQHVAPAEPEQPSPNGVPLPSSYEVQKEDTLVSISRKFYGTPNAWRLIADANRIRKPELIRSGMILTIPAPPMAGNGKSAVVAADYQDGKYFHTIHKNEKLWNIAEKYYGDGLQYKKIIKANPGLNPDKLRIGQKILIPDHKP